MIYMTNEKHGATHVTPSEVAYLQTRGWVVEKEPTSDEIRALKHQAEPTEQPARRGRPPKS